MTRDESMPRTNQDPPGPRLSRRAVLVGAAALTTTTGCLSLSGESGPRERTFTVTITESDGVPAGSVAEADVEGVVRVFVGDTATFTFVNDAGRAVGVHDHASDEEFVVETGGERRFEFEVTEAMVGRQEIEAWFPEESEGQQGRGHDADATSIVVVEVRPQGS